MVLFLDRVRCRIELQTGRFIIRLLNNSTPQCTQHKGRIKNHCRLPRGRSNCYHLPIYTKNKKINTEQTTSVEIQ